MNNGVISTSLEELQQALGCLLPEPMLRLYQDCDNAEQTASSAEMRLMSFEEVAECHQFVRDEGWADLGLRVFWTDDNSNYVGLYTEQLLEGKLCFVDHDEVDLAPVYASVQSFLDAMTAAFPQELSWTEFQTDYPAARPSGNPQAELKDWELSQALRLLYEANKDRLRTYYAFCVMALTPFDQTASLLVFTYDKDMWIQERACRVLGLRRYEPATGRLAEVAYEGKHNGQMAAVRALGKIGSEPAYAHLEGLLLTLPKGYQLYIKMALKRIS